MHTRLLTGTALTLLLFAACKKEERFSADRNDLEEITSSAAGGQRSNENSGSVYTLSNQANGNQVLAYRIGANGALTFKEACYTGGNGTGGGLGNQGAVALTDDEDIVLAVNAGSNSISSLKVTGNGLRLRSTVGSGGVRPVSITVHNDLVYVLNAGGNGSISGFRLLNNGRLQPIPHSTRPLSVAATTAPAQISFVLGGRVLAITEKATNTITTYKVNALGIPAAMHTITSASPTPFGFAKGRLGIIFVSEAVGGAAGASVLSSYRVTPDGHITLVQGSVGAGQSAACWVVITSDGKFAYATNTASNNLSTFNTNVFSGAISVSQAISATTPAGPIDAALTESSKFLYVLNSGDNSISAFKVGANGSLGNVQTLTGLPAGATGLAAD